MFRKLIYLAVMTVVVFFMYPAAESYNFKNGLDKSYATEWLNLYILPNYDTSKIEQVNSTQSYSVRYDIGDDFEAEDQEVRASFDSEYEGEFKVIDENGIFHMLLVNDGTITGVYTNNDEVSVNSVNTGGMDRARINEVYGDPVKTVDKGEKHLVVEHDEYDVFEINGKYVYFFYDIHEEDKVNGLFIIKKSEMNSNSMYDHPAAADNEEMNFHLVNATREKYGVEPLEYHSEASDAARLHSEDMSDDDYFSHVSPEGGTLKDRIEDQDIRFRLAGENIAMGHTSPIFSHHSLMNSEEHRVNILNDAYTHLGTGVDYNTEDVPYYTENYIRQ